MCGIYCVYKQSRSCQLPFCASPIFHFEIGDFSVYIYICMSNKRTMLNQHFAAFRILSLQ